MRKKFEKITLGLLVMPLAFLPLACAKTPAEESDEVAALYEAETDSAAEDETFTDRAGEQPVEFEVSEEDLAADDRAAELAAGERELAEREAELARRERQAAQQLAQQPAPQQTAQQPRYEPAPEPEPQPAPTPVTVATGTSFDAELATSLSSETSQVGDRFTATLTSPLSGGGREAVPAGATIEGRVVEVQATKKIGGRARLGLAFDSVVLADGTQAPLSASLSEVGESQVKEDAKKVGIGAAVGALLGNVIGGGSRTKRGTIGAIVGGAVGTVLAARDEGDPVELPAGTFLILDLEAPLTVVR